MSKCQAILFITYTSHIQLRKIISIVNKFSSIGRVVSYYTLVSSVHVSAWVGLRFSACLSEHSDALLLSARESSGAKRTIFLFLPWNTIY